MTTVRRPRLSKSKFTSGLQCLRRQWWEVHERDAPELVPDAALRAVFAQGTKVGEVAREHVPGGVLINFSPRRMAAAIRETAAAIEAGAPVIYEACFNENGVFAAVDILERAGDLWNLIEVKSTTSAKDQHIPDAAVQTHVAEAAGLRVGRIEIMHLNRECRFPDLSNLFARTDVTEEARSALHDVPAQIEAQRTSLAGPLPEAEIGPRCRKPYDCPFMLRCWPKPPPDPLGELYLLSSKKHSELSELGYETIGQLPSDLSLSAIGKRQLEAVKTDRIIVEEGLGVALVDLQPPLTYLDFETVNPAIPVWHGCGPFQPVVVQFSVHVEDERGAVEHRSWLAQGSEDPQEESVERLLDATSDARRVAVYNVSFERTRILALAGQFPKHASRLERLAGKLIDVLPIVRNHVYHPAFHGSFSLKSVVPALVPSVSYENLGVADGGTAALMLGKVLLESESMSDAEREQARFDLLAYCEQDTWALLELTRALRKLAE